MACARRDAETARWRPQQLWPVVNRRQERRHCLSRPSLLTALSAATLWPQICAVTCSYSRRRTIRAGLLLLLLLLPTMSGISQRHLRIQYKAHDRFEVLV